MRFDFNHDDYEESEIRRYLNNVVYSYFTTEVQNAIKTQSYNSNYNVFSDKVKCPSIRELGYDSYGSLCISEGYIYPIFGSVYGYSTNSLTKYTLTDGSACTYWSRSTKYSNGRKNDDRAYVVNKTGQYTTQTKSSLAAVIACIRF